MDIHQARHILDAAREGADISKASIRQALRATGDLDSTWHPHETPRTLPSQQIPRDDAPAWQPECATERRGKAFE